MDESGPEQRLQPACRGVEVVGSVGPHGQIERDVEEALRTLRDAVLKLDRVVQRCPAIGIGSTTVILAEVDCRGQLADAALEERHDGGAGVGLDVEGEIEVSVERLQVAEPARAQPRRITSDRQRSRPPLADRQRRGPLGEGGRRDEPWQVVEVVVIGDRLHRGHRVECPPEKIGELAAAKSAGLEVEPAEAFRHPADPLVQDLEIARAIAGPATAVGRLPWQHDEEATVEYPATTGEVLHHPPVGLAQGSKCRTVGGGGGEERGRRQLACADDDLQRVRQRIEERGPAIDDGALLGLALDPKCRCLALEDGAQTSVTKANGAVGRRQYRQQLVGAARAEADHNPSPQMSVLGRDA